LLQAKDFLLFHLTGEFASDNWSSKGLIHAETLKPTQAWSSLGLPNELIPAIGKPWDVAAKTSVGNKFLPAGIPVAIGWSDALAGMLALEVFSKPTAFVISGSSDIAGISCAKLSEGKHNLSTVPKSCAPMPVIFGPTQSSGSAISWAAELFNSTPEELLSKSLESRETHDEIFLPYLAGERAPIWRSDIRALFAGLSHQSKFSDIAHAVIFGVGFTARHIIDQAKSLSKELPSVVHLGGASHQSKLWLDIRSRILRSEVISFSESDSSSIGAAILGASAATGISPEVLAPKFSGEKLHFTSAIEDQNTADAEYTKYLNWVERSIR
jgi:xylulokinase